MPIVVGVDSSSRCESVTRVYYKTDSSNNTAGIWCSNPSIEDGREFMIGSFVPSPEHDHQYIFCPAVGLPDGLGFRREADGSIVIVC